MKTLIVISAACGVGKSTIRDALENSGLLPDYACVDTDGVGINWWDYAGTDHESQFTDDCFAEAVRIAKDKNLLFVCCVNPIDFYMKVNLPQEISNSFLIGMTCSEEELTKRLKARPAERMCGSDEFIAGQITYNNWFRKHANKFQYFIDNTGLSVEETAKQIAAFVLRQQ
ncbi:MAG: hypothetical protein IJ468_07395 [Lachnospiraceae bacterium]|nr:hypothetical protein [Lachnospiraceae bacterium]